MELLCFHLDVDVNTGRHFQSGKCIYGLLSGSRDVDQSLMSSLLKLLSGILVLVDCSEGWLLPPSSWAAAPVRSPEIRSSLQCR